MAMLDGVAPLTLKMLNDATIAWLEQDYHRRLHRELGTTPHARLAESADASRPCPGPDDLKAAFRISRRRTLRRSDGTVSVEGVRYQVPRPWRHLGALRVRYARWDPASIDLVDEQTDERLCVLHPPVDKRGNADGARRPAAVDAADGGGDGSGEDGLPPLLRTMLDAQGARNRPAAGPGWRTRPIPTPTIRTRRHEPRAAHLLRAQVEPVRPPTCRSTA